MTCPECRSKTKVRETRESPHGTRRRRECRACGHRFTTFEAEVTRVYEQRGEADLEVDVTEVAQEVSEAVETKLAELPGDVVTALLEEAEARGDLVNGHHPELLPGGED